MENNPHITPENNNSSIPVTEPVNEQEASAQSNPTESPLTDNVPVDDSFWSGEFKPEGEKPRGNANSLPPQNGQASEMPFNAREEGFVPPPQGTVPPMQGTVPPAQGNAPYQVYHSSFENAGPQYHYGYNHKVVDPRYIEEQKRLSLLRKRDRKKLKKDGSTTGIILLILLSLSFVFSLFLSIAPIQRLYNTSFAFSSGMYVLYSVFTLGISFTAGTFIFKLTGRKPTPAFNAPKDITKSVLLVLAGFGGCLGANYITAVMRLFAESAGVYSEYSAVQYPENIFDVILVFISSAVIPPLMEEFAMRGILFDRLRGHGNLFAIIASALIFGIFHGNAVQLPFAFLCGLLLGYSVVASGSIWPAVIIHALTNAVSCVSSTLIYYYDEDAANTFYIYTMIIGIGVGVLAAIIYFFRYKNELRHIISDKNELLSTKEKLVAYLKAPIMIIAIILFVLQAISTLTTTPTVY